MKTFSSIDATREGLEEVSYLPSESIATTVFLALQLGRPILIEGPAGVGKTDLARATAEALGRELIRLQCYEGLDESRALYEWEYGKQLLYTQILRDRIHQLTCDADTLEEAVEALEKDGNIFFSERFLIARPLLRALKESSDSLLLIDEIDKTDAEFEAFLLELLSEFQITIPEIGTYRAETIPPVFLTSNSERDLTEALKRRCLHLHIDYPTEELEEKILARRVPDAPDALRRGVVRAVHAVRVLQIRKPPSISESIDWLRSLLLMGHEVLDREAFEKNLNILLKYQGDIQAALEGSSPALKNLQ
jgi:MoxR-like ATPase